MKFLITTMMLISLIGFAQAEETMGEKAKATSNSAQRSVKKGYHRTKEAMCGRLTGDNKAQCLAKEAKNKVEEASDGVKDKASEVKNSIDTEN